MRARRRAREVAGRARRGARRAGRPGRRRARLERGRARLPAAAGRRAAGRRHGHQRQDDGQRAGRRDAVARPARTWSWPATSAWRCPASRATCRRTAIVVCELSSFQLEDVVTLRCDAAALINLTPDHLDRHGTMEEYGRCKLRIFERQRADRHRGAERRRPVGGGARRAAGRRPRVVRTHGADADGARVRAGRACAAPTTARTSPSPRRWRGRWARRTPTIVRRRGGVPAGAAPARARRRHRRRQPLERLEGHQRRRHAEGADGVSRAARLRIILGGSDKGADFAPLAAGAGRAPSAPPT